MRNNLKLIAILAISFSVMTISVYAAQTVNDRIEIDNDDANITLDNGDFFGYQIEAIGDLDGDGVIDLATIKFSDDTNEANVGSVLILFMNADGSVSSTNEIVMDGTASGLNGCIANDSTNRDTGSLEQLAFVGDLDGDGEPTLALGANSNDHPIANSGAVYMLELNSDGTVDNCLLITEDSNGFDPAIGVYRQSGEGQAANFGWPVIATDLNGDGQNELIVGATSDDDNYTDLWVLFLTTTGAVSSHPATPISGNTDIGIDSGEYLSDGASISGTKIVVSNENDGDGGGSIFIVNLSTTGAFVSVTEIAGSTITGVANDERFGSGVAPLGDMDADGINDIIVGNEAGDDSNSLSGEVHILYLNRDDTVKESQKISNESENTRNSLTPFAASDLFGHGMAVWRDDGVSAIIAISAHQDDTGGETDSGAIHLLYVTRAVTPTTGGSGDEYKSRPTFGIDEKTFAQKVDFGLTINNESFVVDDNFWTEIPMQYLNVGETQNFTAKLYVPKELHVMEFLFGIPEVGKWDEAEASVTLTFDYAGTFEEITWNNDLQLINQTSFTFSERDVLCGSDDTVEQCKQVSIELQFKESPIGEVLALQAIDHKRRSTVLYFNDGITLQGESQNPPMVQQIISEIKYKGLQTVQRIDKENNIWMSMDKSEPVLLYKQNDVGSFFPIEYRNFETIPDKITSNIDRQHSEFGKIQQYEQTRAVDIFDSKLIQGTMPPTFAYEYPHADQRMNNISELIEYEKKRATEMFYQTYTEHERN